jgi:hypothetical protein
MLSCFPDFLHAALEKGACAVFFEENRIGAGDVTYLHRKSGVQPKKGFSRVLGFGIRALRSNQG